MCAGTHLVHRKIICLHSHWLTARYGQCLEYRWWAMEIHFILAMKFSSREKTFRQILLVPKRIWDTCMYSLLLLSTTAAAATTAVGSDDSYVRFYYTTHTYLINHGVRHTFYINKLFEEWYTWIKHEHTERSSSSSSSSHWSSLESALSRYSVIHSSSSGQKLISRMFVQCFSLCVCLTTSDGKLHNQRIIVVVRRITIYLPRKLLFC